jgi:hypothetical protein
MKIALPLMSRGTPEFEGRIGWRDFAIAAVLIVVPVYLIKRQPDLGTALLIGASGFYVLFLAGLSWKVIVGWQPSPARSAPLLGQLDDYQRERVRSRSSRDLPALATTRRRHRCDRVGRHRREGLAERHADHLDFAGTPYGFHLAVLARNSFDRQRDSLVLYLLRSAARW